MNKLPAPIEAIYKYDIDSIPEQFDAWCKDSTFVFNLALVNRPQKQEEFMEGNFGFAIMLLTILKKYGKPCPPQGSLHYNPSHPTHKKTFTTSNLTS